MKTVVFDVDDVLNNLIYNWFIFYKKNNNIDIKYWDIKENPLYDILNISKEDFLKSLDYYKRTYLYELYPNDIIIDWFEKNGNKAYFIALTSPPLDTADISAYWVMRYFGKWIRTISFIPSIRDNKEIIYDSSKADYIQRIGNVDIFIDDNEDNYNEVSRLGIKSFLVDQPWNSGNLKLIRILKIIEGELDYV